MTKEIRELFDALETERSQKIEKSPAKELLKKLSKIDELYEEKAEVFLANERARQQKNAELSRISFLG